VQTFIWSNDEVGRMVMFELIEAARRGVHVRIIADQMFSEQDPAIAAFAATAHPNLEIKHYRPILSRIKPSLAHTLIASVESFHGVNQRMHSKVMLFDDAVLITGGRNIENGYYDHSTELNYRDRDVLAIGPVAMEAAKEFEEFWTYKHAVSSRDLADVADVIASGKFRRFERREDYDFGPSYEALNHEADDAALIEHRFATQLRGVAKATFFSDEPGKSHGFFSKTARITRQLRGTLESAHNRIVMQTPYLVLSNRARELLHDLEQKHHELRIRIVTNSFASTDNILAYSGNYRLRTRYVEDLNLDVHEFKPEPATLRELLPRYDELVVRAQARIQAGKQKRTPFLCVHAKSLVIDDRVAFIGSYNLDPRSERLNTEVGLLIEDETIAKELSAEIERDMQPENSWVIAKRAMPLPVSAVNGLVSGILSLSPLDVWPIQNTSSFDLKPGAIAVPPSDPAFYRNYREVGSFPGTEGLFSTKEILTRLYKAVGPPLTPIL
jgi:phosphatidylserine/phosphatidylglycerophosphate/cardiolipin synthase-like enzyme